MELYKRLDEVFRGACKKDPHTTWNTAEEVVMKAQRTLPLGTSPSIGGDRGHGCGGFCFRLPEATTRVASGTQQGRTPPIIGIGTGS